MLKVQLKPLETESLIFSKGWNRQQLANEAHVSMITLCPVLNGKPCGIKVALKIAKALGVNVKDIIITPENTPAIGHEAHTLPKSRAPDQINSNII